MRVNFSADSVDYLEDPYGIQSHREKHGTSNTWGESPVPTSVGGASRPTRVEELEKRMEFLRQKCHQIWAHAPAGQKIPGQDPEGVNPAYRRASNKLGPWAKATWKKWTLEQVDLYYHLNDLLSKFVTLNVEVRVADLGACNRWNGRGGRVIITVPSSERGGPNRDGVMIWPSEKSEETAFVDTKREKRGDDKMNVDWGEAYEGLGPFRQVLREVLGIQPASNKKGKGDFVESIVGIAYAVITQGSRLPEGMTVSVEPKEAEWMWCSIWHCVQVFPVYPILPLPPGMDKEYPWNRNDQDIRLVGEGEPFADLRPSRTGEMQIWGLKHRPDEAIPWSSDEEDAEDLDGDEADEDDDDGHGPGDGPDRSGNNDRWDSGGSGGNWWSSRNNWQTSWGTGWNSGSWSNGWKGYSGWNADWRSDDDWYRRRADRQGQERRHRLLWLAEWCLEQNGFESELNDTWWREEDPRRSSGVPAQVVRRHQEQVKSHAMLFQD